MAESRERVYILSEDYWGFDAASKNDTLNFYDNVWILKKNQYDGLSEEVRNQLYRCALFYHKSRVDNHGYTPLAIRDEGTTVKVRGPNRQGLVEMRTYDDGGQSPPYVVTDGTDTITMRSADPAATDMSQLEAVGANTTPGTFLIGQFIYEEKDILDTINKLESEIGDVINMKTAEFISPTDVLPVPSSYEESRPLAENPQTEGFSAHGCGCGVSGCGDCGSGCGCKCMCAEGEAAPETAPASAAIQVSDPHAANPPAELYSTAIVQQDPTGIEGGYTPQDTFISAADTDVSGINPDKTHKMGPKSATLQHRLSAKARRKARKAARAAKALSMSYGAEEAVPLTQEVPMGEEMRQVMTTQAYGQAGGNYDHMIHYSADGVETPGSDDNYVMMPDAGMDILAPANAYGTNSAIVSGQGVPQWYGSAESEVNEVVMSDNVDETHVPGVPVVPNQRGEDSSIAGYGVPQWYGSAESKFDTLAHKISMSYQDKGMSVSEANEVGRKTAAVIGRRKFGSKKFAQMGAKGRRKARRGRKSAESVNPMYLSDNVDETHVMGVPVMNNSWGGDSAGGIGRGAPQWYGSAEVNPMYFEQVDGHDALGVGLPVISNDYGEDSAGGIGRGVPQFYGAEAPASVAVDESSPDSYQPYDFVDEMSPDGEYMTGDDFMTLLSETIDGMGARYKKPSMFQKPVAMVAAGGLMAWLGLNLYNRQ